MQNERAEAAAAICDGLLQRYIPTMVAPARFREDRPSNPEAYGKLVRQMIFAKPTRLIMTDAALAVMDALHRRLFDLGAASEGLSTGFQTFVGKLEGLAGSLALILHMAHHLANDPGRIGSGVADPVSEHTIEK